MPGAGSDDIDFSRLPSGVAVCNCFEHEIGIAEYVLANMLEWSIGIRRMDQGFRQGSWAGSFLLSLVALLALRLPRVRSDGTRDG